MIAARSICVMYILTQALGYTNKMSWFRWHQWSTEAGGLAVYCFNFYTLFNEEAPFYWEEFGRGGTILLVILERRPHFIGYLREEAPFYWVNCGEGWWSFVIYVQNNAGGCLEFHFMAHALPGGLVIQMIKLFYWCGLSIKARSIIVFTQHEWNIRLWHFL